MNAHFSSLLDADEASGRNFLVVYDDATGEPIVKGYTVKGHPSIGIGRALDSAHGISVLEQDSMFATDEKDCETRLNAAFPGFAALSDGRQYVLVNMTFQMGFGGLMGFPNMLRAFWEGDWPAAAAECLNSKVAKEFPERYNRLVYIIRNGHDPSALA